ncbi:MAG: oxygenase MpaB family protein [Candidatus Promineifilaceae bacterium]
MKLLNSAEKEALRAQTIQTYTPTYLASWRQQRDPLADAVVASIAADIRGVVPDGYPDLLAACEAFAADGDVACRRFLDVVHSTPDWVDHSDFEAGRVLFRRNGVLTFLTGISVLVSSYGGYKDNKVLVLSNRLGEGDSFRRAVETAQFTLNVTKPDGLHVGGSGWRSILQVRLLHARVRQFCVRGNFPVALYDQPINQEAMCGAIMLFSHGVIRALELLNVTVTELEKESYHALWRYGGWLMGVDVALLPERHVEEETLFDLHQYDYHPDADTDKLFNGTVGGIVYGAKNLPLWMTLLGGGMLRSRAFVENFVGYTVNDALRDHLALQPTFGWRFLFGAIRVVLGMFSFIQTHWAGFGRIQHRIQNSLMQRMIATLSADDPVQFNNTGLLS